MRLRSRRALATVSIAICATSAAAAGALWPRPARLATLAGAENDTIVVNHAQPTRISVSVLDQYGRRLPSDTAVRFRLISGAIALSPTGGTACTRREDGVVRVTFVRLAKDFVLHCRPVVSLEAASWLDLVGGDSPRDLSFVARGPDGVAVTELRGSVTVEDPSIAQLIGTAVRPKKPGKTVAIVTIGDVSATIVVVVHRLVTSFVGNPQNQDLLAIRVHVTRGDTVEVPVPKAAFWVKYFPRDSGAAPPTIELHGNGSCVNGDGIRIQRVENGEYAKYCRTDNGTTIMIAHGEAGADTVAGTITLDLNWQ
jgi:hypothetical protein